jgi:hypothetical protein
MLCLLFLLLFLPFLQKQVPLQKHGGKEAYGTLAAQAYAASQPNYHAYVAYWL